MSGFRVGLGDLIVNSRYSPTAFARADYLTATASGIDSLWLGDHLNSLYPRSVATPKYLGVARLIPKVEVTTRPMKYNTTNSAGPPTNAAASRPATAARIRVRRHRGPRWRARA